MKIWQNSDKKMFNYVREETKDVTHEIYAMSVTVRSRHLCICLCYLVREN
jgi:hypothetical protein